MVSPLPDAPADSSAKSVQERYAPGNRCFGCGPANELGLRIRSFPAPDSTDGLVCAWRPQPHHEAFPGVLNGGIVGALLDCHANWTAACHLMRRDGTDAPPCTVTADFHVRMRHPTPSDQQLALRSRVLEAEGKRVKVLAELLAGERVTATCEGTFVAVGPGHPAYHRW
jgi:acyl-coenzyme A thioesterase PaaI-like protein